MTALTRASVVRTVARLCFLVLFQTSGIYIPQLLAQSTQADTLRKQVAEMQATAMKSAALAAGTAMAAPAQLGGENLVPAAAPMTVAAKKAGVRRIGLLLPANQMDGKGALNDGEAIRDAEMQLLTGPTLEAVRLHAVLPEQALAEARALDCDAVLAATVTQQTAASSGGRFSKLMNMRTVHLAATAAQFIPAVQGAALMTNLVSSQLMQMPQMLNVSKAVRANSDVRFEYTLTDAAGTVKLHDVEQQHSTSDGENVLTPLLTNAAKKVAATLGN